MTAGVIARALASNCSILASLLRNCRDEGSILRPRGSQGAVLPVPLPGASRADLRAICQALRRRPRAGNSQAQALGSLPDMPVRHPPDPEFALLRMCGQAGPCARTSDVNQCSSLGTRVGSTPVTRLGSMLDDTDQSEIQQASRVKVWLDEM